MSQPRGMRDFAFYAVIVAIPIASYFLVFAPRNAEIAKARDEISAKRTRLASIRNSPIARVLIAFSNRSRRSRSDRTLRFVR